MIRRGSVLFSPTNDIRGLPLDDAPLKPRHRPIVLLILLVLSITDIFFLSPHPVSFTRTAARDFQRLPTGCPTQHSPLSPAIPFSLSHKAHVYVKRLQGAVQIRTVRRRTGMIRDTTSLTSLRRIFWRRSLMFLMAHQDTVPVPDETVERWTHPTFEGYVDHEGWVWGRGVAD
ncbi:hypothetical protein FB451DRAFT_1564004 [Mycena latifolia]|nr:hypothetical protein FB451DRAFT_1564004 [Mycena latifolia]